jgi:hypothetical protein
MYGFLLVVDREDQAAGGVPERCPGAAAWIAANWVPSMNAALIRLMMPSMTFGKVSELILNQSVAYG